jgi:hypothetical protein
MTLRVKFGPAQNLVDLFSSKSEKYHSITLCSAPHFALMAIPAKQLYMESFVGTDMSYTFFISTFH